MLPSARLTVTPRILGDPDALRPEPQDMLVEGGQQDRLEQSAVHHDRWRVDAGHSRFRRARSKWSSSRAAERTIGRDRARVRDGRPDVQPLEHPDRVRPQQDPGADLVQLRGLLENHHLKAGSAQGDGRAEPTDTCADDDNLPCPGTGSHLLKGSLICPVRRYAPGQRLESAGSLVMLGGVADCAGARRGWA